MSLARARIRFVVLGALLCWTALGVLLARAASGLPAEVRASVSPGDVARGLGLGALELAALTLFILWDAAAPRRRPWLRVWAAGFLWLPYAAFALLASVHRGPIGTAHAVWRVALLLLLLIGAPVLMLRPTMRGDSG